MFSLRIVNVDHYMSPPKPGIDLSYSQFRGNQIKSVPVIRVFGSTPSGSKACLHVHGVFLYLLVPYSGQEDAGRFLYQLASSLDKAINVSLGTSFSQKQHVFKITQVSGRPFYGYHGQDYQFLKIFFYSPLIIKRASDLLQRGAVCGTQFQIHESHVPFILQFFIDYNLYGMSFINLKSVVFRKDGNPAGVASGNLTKESFCELEADAVAVDILNRLTVEGELAVNPGLADIWNEEKERLQKDALESSQRATPQRTMSEVLLMDRLRENLRFQGRCKPLLKDRIPYPVETQRSDSSEMLDASVLDTHSVTSLRASDPTVDEPAVVDEELALSLSQSAGTSSSMDQSLLMALDVLAAREEDLGPVIAQNVEDDSILGSQMLPEEGSWDENSNEDDHAAVDFSLPPHNEVQESDDSFDGKIPQVDGVGDVVTNKKKPAKKKRKALVKNASNEDTRVFNMEESLVNNGKDSGCWPDSGRQEGLDEIFSDEEPFNSPMHNFEDNGSIEEEPLNIDIVTSFDTVLTGDPALPCDDNPSSEELLLFLQKNDESGWNILNSSVLEETCDKSFLYTDFDNNKLTETILDIESVDEEALIEKSKDDSVSNVPLPNNTSTVADKQREQETLPSFCDYLLNTCQLDEILNEDLNKALDNICENDAQYNTTGSPFHKSETGATDNDITKIESEEYIEDLITDEQMSTSMEVHGPPDYVDETVPDLSQSAPDCEMHFTTTHPSDPISIVPSEPLLADSQTETATSNNFKEKLGYENKDGSKSVNETKENEKTMSKQKKFKIANGKRCKSQLKSFNSPHTKNTVDKPPLFVKMFQRKIKTTFLSQYETFDMTDDEIKQYFSQLEYLASFFAGATGKCDNEEESKSLLWTPIRIFTKISKCKTVRKGKTTKSLPVNEAVGFNFPGEGITCFNSCSVRMQRLTLKAVKMLCHRHNFKTDLSVFHKRSVAISKLNKAKDRRNEKNSDKQGGKRSVAISKLNKAKEKKNKKNSDKQGGKRSVAISKLNKAKEKRNKKNSDKRKSIKHIQFKEKSINSPLKTEIQYTVCERKDETLQSEQKDKTFEELPVRGLTGSSVPLQKQITQATNPNSSETMNNAHCSNSSSGVEIDQVKIINTKNKQLSCNKGNSVMKQKIFCKSEYVIQKINKNKTLKKRKLNPTANVSAGKSSENNRVPITSKSDNYIQRTCSSAATIDISKSDRLKKIKKTKNKVEKHKEVNGMSDTDEIDKINLKKSLGILKKKPTLKRSCKHVSSKFSSGIVSPNSKNGSKLELIETKEMRSNATCITDVDEIKMSKKNETLISKNTMLNNNNFENDKSKLKKLTSSEKAQLTKRYCNETSTADLQVDSKFNGLPETKNVKLKEVKDINGKENISICTLNNIIMGENEGGMVNIDFNLNNNCENDNTKLHKPTKSTEKISNTRDRNTGASLDSRSERSTSDLHSQNVKAGLKHNGFTRNEDLRKEFEQKDKKQNDTRICTSNTNKREESKENTCENTVSNRNKRDKGKFNKQSCQPSPNPKETSNGFFLKNRSESSCSLSTQDLKSGLKQAGLTRNKEDGLARNKEMRKKEFEQKDKKQNDTKVCTPSTNKTEKCKKNTSKNTASNQNESDKGKLNNSSDQLLPNLTESSNGASLNNASESNSRISTKDSKDGSTRKKELRNKKLKKKETKQNDTTICATNSNKVEDSKTNTLSKNTVSNKNSKSQLGKLSKSLGEPSPNPKESSNGASLNSRSESSSRISTQDLKAALKHDGLTRKKELRKKEEQQNGSTNCTPNISKIEDSKKNTIGENTIFNKCSENREFKLKKSSNQPLEISALSINCSDVLSCKSKCITIPALVLKQESLHGALKKETKIKSSKISENNKQISVNCKKRLKNTENTVTCDGSSLNNVYNEVSFDDNLNKIESPSPVEVVKPLIPFKELKLKTTKNEKLLENINDERQPTISSQIQQDANSKSNLKLNHISDTSSCKINSTNRVPVVCLDVCNILTKYVPDKKQSIIITVDESSLNSDDTCQSNKTNVNVFKSHQPQCSNAIIKDFRKPLFDKLQTSESLLRKRSFSFDCNDESQKGIKVRKKKSNRIVSLDGTCDNSSSDENVEDIIKDIDIVGDDSNWCSTPRRTRSISSRTSRSPKTNYVPLNIEIKKSPKVKKIRLKRLAETKSTSEVCVNIQQPTEETEDTTQVKSELNETSRDIEVSEVVEKKCEFDRKRRRLEPSVRVERLILSSEQEPTESALVEMNSEVPSHLCAKDPNSDFIHPSVKRLKVSVRRMSLNTQGNQCEEQKEDPTVRDHRTHRSSSLPVTTK